MCQRRSLRTVRTTAGAPASACRGRRAATRGATRGGADRRCSRATTRTRWSAPSRALLAFAPELETATAPSDPETLRTRLLDELISARDARGGARRRRWPAPTPAAWAVAALLDDLALNTPWGGASAWPRQPLVLDALRRRRCRHAASSTGSRSSSAIRAAIRRCSSSRTSASRSASAASTACPAAPATARSPRSAPPPPASCATPRPTTAPLSPNWQGVVAADAPRRFAVPIWVLFAAARRRLRRALPRCSRCASRGQADAARRRSPARCRRPSAPRSTARRPRHPAGRAAAGGEPVDFALLPEFAGRRARRPAAGAARAGDASRSPRWSSSGANPELFQSARAELTDGLRAADRLDRPRSSPRTRS